MFSSPTHSWSQIGRHFGEHFTKLGHEVDLISTNGPANYKSPVHSLFKEKPSGDYDLSLSYTIPPNFPVYLSGGKKKFGIWNYETEIIPRNFVKYFSCCDLFLPSSNFSKNIFIQNGVPENIQKVIPHGIDLNVWKEEGEKYPLKTKKKWKILVDIAQPHLRKNWKGILQAYSLAFNKKDDVCLVAKVVIKKNPDQSHEENFLEILNGFKSKYKNLGEIEVIGEYLPDMTSLYRSCDILLGMSYSECFGLNFLQAIAMKKLILAPNYGGQLDFLNSSNCLLIETERIRCPKELQYWTSSPYAAVHQPSVEDAARLMKEGIENYQDLLERFIPNMESKVKDLEWSKISQEVLNLA